MNHPENITFTFILVVYYFAKKKYEKQNETATLASFWLICTLFWHICTLLWTSDLYVRLESARIFDFRRQKQTPFKNKYKLQNSENTTELANSQAIKIRVV
jgi:hypothetical protein